MPVRLLYYQELFYANSSYLHFLHIYIYIYIYVCVCVCVCVDTNPSHEQDMTQGQFLCEV